MKKILMSGISATLALVMLAGCSANTTSGTGDSSTGGSESRAISVISREDGSGTRGAFIELLGIEEKNESGEKVDNTIQTAEITNSTSVMMTTVAGNPDAIGYISLGSLNDTVKALKVDGVEATAENVKNGTYKVSRPFNIATKEGVSEVAQDFIKFIMSPDGQAIVEEEGCVSKEAGEAYTPSGMSGTINISGSSSVTPAMEALKEAYVALNPDVTINLQQSDSTTGMNDAIEGVSDIGMASRELKDSEIEAGLTPTVIALDGIAVIVNNENTVEDITADQIKGIYTGEITDWSEIK